MIDLEKGISFKKGKYEFQLRELHYHENIMGGLEPKAEYKIVGVDENKNLGELINDGFYGTTYLPDKDAFTLKAIKLDGKNINGVSIPDELKEDFKDAYRRAKEQFDLEKINKQREIDEKYCDDTKIKVSEDYRAIRSEFHESTRGKVIEALLEDKKVKETVAKAMEDYKTGCDWGDYSNTYYFELTVKQYETIVNEISDTIIKEREHRKLVKKEKEDAIFKMAKDTGEKQLLYKYTDACNDPREDCELDIVYTFAMPDGTMKEERSHTW